MRGIRTWNVIRIGRIPVLSAAYTVTVVVPVRIGDPMIFCVRGSHVNPNGNSDLLRRKDTVPVPVAVNAIGVMVMYW